LVSSIQITPAKCRIEQFLPAPTQARIRHFLCSFSVAISEKAIANDVWVDAPHYVISLIISTVLFCAGAALGKRGSKSIAAWFTFIGLYSCDMHAD
jgi:hypothetical protein